MGGCCQPYCLLLEYSLSSSSSLLQALVCSSLPFSPSLYTSNPIVTGTLAQIRHHFGRFTLHQTTAICNNHLFLTGPTPLSSLRSHPQAVYIGFIRPKPYLRAMCLTSIINITISRVMGLGTCTSPHITIFGRSPPSFKVWLCDTLSSLKPIKVKFTLKGSSDKFYSQWKPLIN